MKFVIKIFAIYWSSRYLACNFTYTFLFYFFF